MDQQDTSISTATPETGLDCSSAQFSSSASGGRPSTGSPASSTGAASTISPVCAAADFAAFLAAGSGISDDKGASVDDEGAEAAPPPYTAADFAAFLAEEGAAGDGAAAPAAAAAAGGAGGAVTAAQLAAFFRASGMPPLPRRPGGFATRKDVYAAVLALGRGKRPVAWDHAGGGRRALCWVWPGAKAGSHQGGRYGVAFVAAEGRWLRVPRLAWEHFAGAAMPAGHFACHHCDNPSCCNPGHIFSGTQKQNMEDAAAKGRTACGERNRNAKLTARTVHCFGTRTPRGCGGGSCRQSSACRRSRCPRWWAGDCGSA